jgi:hypothetical protein
MQMRRVATGVPTHTGSCNLLTGDYCFALSELLQAVIRGQHQNESRTKPDGVFRRSLANLCTALAEHDESPLVLSFDVKVIEATCRPLQ